jgi:predicted HTH transcriptional regulator
VEVTEEKHEKTELKNSNNLEYLLIPKEILWDNDLEGGEKMLLAMIRLLDNESGCYATNSYFASILKVSRKTITRMIKKLVNKGKINFIGKVNNKRVIRLYHE